jgi:cell division protease FtsH
VAYHEVGHAICIAVQKHTEPVQKITIVPRTMGALGYTMQVPEEERHLMSKEKILDELVTFFGGRAAEEVVFQSITTGASNDIERATKLARAMVTQYGMSETFGLMGLESIESRYLDGRPVMNCSDATGALIDNEVKNILKDAYNKAVEIIKGNREALDEIAAFLIDKETITGKEFMEIFNKFQEEEKKPEAEVVEVQASDVEEIGVQAEEDKKSEVLVVEDEESEIRGSKDVELNSQAVVDIGLEVQASDVEKIEVQAEEDIGLEVQASDVEKIEAQAVENVELNAQVKEAEELDS